LSPDLKGGLSIEGVKRLKKQWVYNLNSRKANQNKYKKREEKREKKKHNICTATDGARLLVKAACGAPFILALTKWQAVQ